MPRCMYYHNTIVFLYIDKYMYVCMYVCMVIVEGRFSGDKMIRSQLHLVDLAGSERVS